MSLKMVNDIVDIENNLHHVAIVIHLLNFEILLIEPRENEIFISKINSIFQ
jgi:hypothetical protein